MILIRNDNKKKWHISDNNRSSLCRSFGMMKMDRKTYDYHETPNLQVVEISESDEAMKDNLCPSCVGQAYKKGLLEVKFK